MLLCDLNLKGLFHAARDSYRDHSMKKTWGNLKITLLDTNFWPKMSEDPNEYHERYRTRVDLVGYDLVVMPMFGK